MSESLEQQFAEAPRVGEKPKELLQLALAESGGGAAAAEGGGRAGAAGALRPKDIFAFDESPEAAPLFLGVVQVETEDDTIVEDLVLSTVLHEPAAQEPVCGTCTTLHLQRADPDRGEPV